MSRHQFYAKPLFIAVLATLVLSGCYASSNLRDYSEQTARAIIDSGNNICITIFLGAVIRAICNK